MKQQVQQQRTTRARKLVSLGMWLVAAGAAALVGLDPEDVAARV